MSVTELPRPLDTGSEVSRMRPMIHLSGPVVLSIIALAASATSGCGKKEGKAAGKVGACDRIKAEGLCVQFGDENFSAAGEEFLKSTCDTMEGSFSLAECPAENRIGTCDHPEGMKVHYNSGEFTITAEKAKEYCSHTWTPAK